jgi:hypothetical protein
MKKKLILYAFAMAAFTLSFAQPRGGGMRANRLEAVKIAFLTKYINLSSDEAQKFWPTYNAYDNEIKKVRQANMQDELAFGEAVLNIKKRYKPEFKKILNDDIRVNNTFKAEGEFRIELQKELRKRIQEKSKGPQK